MEAMNKPNTGWYVQQYDCTTKFHISFVCIKSLFYDTFLESISLFSGKYKFLLATCSKAQQRITELFLHIQF